MNPLIRTESTINTICNKRISALNTYLPNNGTLTIDGKPVAADTLVAEYQACLDTRKEVDDARTLLTSALKARKVADAARRALEKNLKPAVLAKFGAGSDAAVAFGYTPKSPKVPVATKMDAVTKNLATRKARKTLGKKQKKNIKGGTVAASAPPTPATVGAKSAAPSNAQQ